MSRDFWKDGFTAGDFAGLYDSGEPDFKAAEMANAILKAELEKAVEVYCQQIDSHGWFAGQEPSHGDTHSARLVRVEELEK